MSGEPRTGSWRRRLRVAGLALAAFVLLTSPWIAPALFSHLSFFRLQRIEVHGLRYMPESVLRERLAVDTTMSVWMDLRELEKKLEGHPQLRSVTLSRRLPGTLVVRVDERRPLALVPRAQGFVAIDDSGAIIPLDLSTGTVDVPILRDADTVLVRLLAVLRKEQPALYERVSEVTPIGRDEVRIELRTVTVLAMSDVTVQRLLDILPVERDLRAKGIKAAELDLRYQRDVIVRVK